MASEDDTFTGGVAGHVRRVAERREADRQEQARADAVAIEHKARLYAEQMRQELLARRSSVPTPAPEPAPAPVSVADMDAMSPEEYAAHRRAGR
jgi:hypothetical protein